MSLKLLIADDSLTIQKVIKIALANEDFDISVCSSSEDLVSSIKKENPKIVLLDSNLSEEKNEFELTSMILEQSSDIQILMLYRTFDTIDKQALEESKVSNYIVKPFDGNEFINKCRKMRDHFEKDEDFSKNISEIEQIPEVIESTSDEEQSQEWVMNVPDPIDNEVSPVESVKIQSSDQLEKGLADWGMDVPSIIGQESNTVEVPEIIPSSEIMSSSEVQAIDKGLEQVNTNDDVKYPSSDDLEYPDMDELTGPSSKLISLDDLDSSDEDKTTEFEIPSHTDESVESHVRNIEREIADEIEEDDDLWAVDEVVEIDEPDDDIPMVEPHKLHEVMKNTPELSHLVEEHNEVPEDFPSDVTLEDSDIAEKIKKDLTPLIEEYVKSYCSEHIERIAWEVIPDLAENIIKNEIKKISENVINSEF